MNVANANNVNWLKNCVKRHWPKIIAMVCTMNHAAKRIHRPQTIVTTRYAIAGAVPRMCAR